MVYGTQITIVTGAYINQLITGGPHIVSILHGIWSLAWCHVTKYVPEELLYIYIYIPASNMHPTQIIPNICFVFPWLQHSVGWKSGAPQWPAQSQRFRKGPSSQSLGSLDTLWFHLTWLTGKFQMLVEWEDMGSSDNQTEWLMLARLNY